jgi:hypothetical protein
MKYLRKFEDWNSVRPPSHHTEDILGQYFKESDDELKPGDFVKTVATEQGVFDKHPQRYHKIVYGIWNGVSVETFSKDRHTVRNKEWLKKVELIISLEEFISKLWEFARKELHK